MIISTAEEMNPCRRHNMEDCHVTLLPGSWKGAPAPHNMAYLGVYDGHGGREICEFLEQVLDRNVATELSLQDDVDIPTRLERAFLLTDIQSRMAGITTSGATVAMCLVTTNTTTSDSSERTVVLHTANAGDARIVLSSSNGTASGKALRLTHDHRADDPEEVARIEQAGGFVLKGRVLGILSVARSLGDHGLKQYVIAKPYVQTTNLVLNDVDDVFVILACDGLWDVLQDQQAVDLVKQWLRHGTKKEDIAQKLCDEAIKRGSTDNVTVVVAWL